MKRRKAKLLKPSVAYNFLLHHNSMSKKKKENFLAVIQTPSLRKQKTINIFKLDSPNQVRSSRRNDGLKNYFVWDGFQTAIVILFRKLFIAVFHYGGIITPLFLGRSFFGGGGGERKKAGDFSPYNHQFHFS